MSPVQVQRGENPVKMVLIRKKEKEEKKKKNVRNPLVSPVDLTMRARWDNDDDSPKNCISLCVYFPFQFLWLSLSGHFSLSRSSGVGLEIKLMAVVSFNQLCSVAYI